MRRTEARLVREVSRRTRHLRSETERRRRLEREMLEITATEHRRIAQDLHDGLGQYLSALAFHARMLTDDLRQQQSPHAEQAQRITTLVRTTNQMTRQLDRALRVPEAKEGGLFSAIRVLAAEFEGLTGVRCDVHCTDAPVVLDDVQVQMLFRIAQEALNNAVKHARPSVIRIAADVTGETLVIRVVDDGKDVAAIRESDSGSGIRTMKLRAEVIGGSLQVKSGEGGGCTVECAVPLNRSTEAS